MKCTSKPYLNTAPAQRMATGGPMKDREHQQRLKITNGNHNIILGGSNNTLSGNCSAILGGDGNSDGGFNYVGIYGFGITALADNAFYAHNYVVQNMPDRGTGGTYVANQLYYDSTAGSAVFIG